MQEWITPIIAVVGTIFGGAGLEFTKRWLNRNKEKSDIATDFRSELRKDLKDVKVELEKAEEELDLWKKKYYDVYEKYLDVSAKYQEALRQIQKDTNASIRHAAQSLDGPPGR